MVNCGSDAQRGNALKRHHTTPSRGQPGYSLVEAQQPPSPSPSPAPNQSTGSGSGTSTSTSTDIQKAMGRAKERDMGRNLFGSNRAISPNVFRTTFDDAHPDTHSDANDI
ncbi:hypothetical protein HYALB_00004595 [Hymenoscyphus albidus]|uniref:Uncharacterized protein n=1 Tax=Hymenoscyphus albidus TaxID=595503 RepID=A0A9N9M3K9_9HELO|nr:hypothetical protein HYALB_00004595 [Hymenoscyphus albidus]